MMHKHISPVGAHANVFSEINWCTRASAEWSLRWRRGERALVWRMHAAAGRNLPACRGDRGEGTRRPPLSNLCKPFVEICVRGFSPPRIAPHRELQPRCLPLSLAGHISVCRPFLHLASCHDRPPSASTPRCCAKDHAGYGAGLDGAPLHSWATGMHNRQIHATAIGPQPASKTRMRGRQLPDQAHKNTFVWEILTGWPGSRYALLICPDWVSAVCCFKALEEIPPWCESPISQNPFTEQNESAPLRIQARK